MDCNNYLVIKNNSFIHKYGDKLQIWADVYGFYGLNQLQGDIVQMCDGTHTIEEIWLYILNKYSLKDNIQNKELFLNVVSKLLDKNIVDVTPEKMYRKIIQSGKENANYPVWLVCELTNVCNCSCPHCYKEAKSNGIYLDMFDINKICDEFSGYTPSIVLTGGEPLLHPNIDEIIRKSTEHFETSVITNGILINSIDFDLLQRLKHIQISLYGYDDLSYYKFTGCKDGFSKLQKSMKKIEKCDKVEIMTTLIITKDNMYELEKYLRAAIEMGAPAIKFAISTPMGRARGKNNVFSFNRDENILIRNMVDELREKFQGKIRVLPFDNLLKSIPINKDEFGCEAGKSTIIIDETGNIRPCNLLPASVFRKYSLDEYIRDINQNQSRNYGDDIIQLRIEMEKTGDKLEDMKCIGFCKVN